MRLAALLACSLTALTFSSAALPSAAAPSRGTVLDLGDSLSAGTAPYLARRLAGYRLESRYDVGLHAYDAAALVERRRSSLPPILVVSAGTNDDPRIVSTFARAVSTVLRAAGGRRCVVWSTIVRPPAAGASYDGFNRTLLRMQAQHRNLVVVRWDRIVRRHPGWLRRDGVHVGAAGYDARARAIAHAVRERCASAEGTPRQRPLWRTPSAVLARPGAALAVPGLAQDER